jgi:UDP-galactopyranose mutase
LCRYNQELAAKESGVCFVGRLASYKYFNMDQAFLNALEMFDEMKAGGKVATRTELGEGDGPK